MNHQRTSLGSLWRDGALVACPGERALLARVAALRSKGMASWAIGDVLAAEGFRTRKGTEYRGEVLRRLVRRC